jgi:hypothetical protein
MRWFILSLEDWKREKHFFNSGVYQIKIQVKTIGGASLAAP